MDIYRLLDQEWQNTYFFSRGHDTFIKTHHKQGRKTSLDKFKGN